MSYYGFSFLRENSGGLGASINAVLSALVYARHNKLKLGLIKEDLKFPLLNGSIKDDTEEKNWYSYFRSFPTISKKDVVAIWRDCPSGFNADIPLKYKRNGIKRIEWYSQLLKNKVFILREDIKADVERRIIRSGFNPHTDIVLHVRRTDKIYQTNGSIVESGELPLDEYVMETVKIINKLDKPNLRVFLCTDDKKIYNHLLESFGKFKIPIVWDQHESNKELQVMRMAGQLTQSEAHDENINALKIMMIMSRGLYLIGGRMSYIFRVGELLRYPLPTKNIKDSDIFGKAPYASPDECLVNPFYSRRYTSFISPKHENVTISETRNIITIHDFMNDTVAEQVYQSLQSYNNNWWVHAIRPDENGNIQHLQVGDFAKIFKYHTLAEKAADNGLFAYHFKRTLDDHYPTCYCVYCRLKSTFESYDVIKFLSNITGYKFLSLGETFVSQYERGHFLNIHHDKNKGDYAFVLSLTKDWNPSHGGNLHFWDAEKQSIYQTVSPKFNTLTIFKLSPDEQMDHFVSQVCGPHKRFAFTGWFNVEH